MSDSFDVIVIGQIGYDITTTRTGTRTVKAGAAYYVAVAAACFSPSVAVVSRVGTDFHLETLRHILNLDGVVVMPDQPSSRFYHEYSDDFQTRSFRAELGAGQYLVPDDIPSKYFNAKYIHVATMPPVQQKQFLKFIRGRSASELSIDTLEQYISQDPQQVAAVLAMADIIFMNKREIELLETLRGKKMVIKKGPEGAELIFAEDMISLAAPSANVIDPTGSGDVLAGALLASLAQGVEVQKALSDAIALASRSIEDYGIETILRRALCR